MFLDCSFHPVFSTSPTFNKQCTNEDKYDATNGEEQKAGHRYQCHEDGGGDGDHHEGVVLAVSSESGHLLCHINV